jgi:hypothetical protein
MEGQMAYRRKAKGQVGPLFLWLALLAFVLSACIPATGNESGQVSASSYAKDVLKTAVDPQTPVHAQSTPGLAAQAEESLDTCMVGNWTVADLQRSMIESHARSNSPLVIQSVEGETRYAFRPGGILEISFENLVTTLSGVIEGKDIQARSRMTGVATAEFSVNAQFNEVVFSNFGGDGIVFTTEINGQVLGQGNFPAWRAFSSNLAGNSPEMPTAGPTRVVNQSYAAVTCVRDEMRLQTIDPTPGQEVKLRRIE